MLRDPWYRDNKFRSVHGAHTASILSFWPSMTVALGNINSIAGLHASYNIHMKKCYFFVHNLRCLWYYTEAMFDAGVLSGLLRAAAQDMAIYTMLVRMICTQVSFSQCAIQRTIMCMIAVVHSC